MITHAFRISSDATLTSSPSFLANNPTAYQAEYLGESNLNPKKKRKINHDAPYVTDKTLTSSGEAKFTSRAWIASLKSDL